MKSFAEFMAPRRLEIMDGFVATSQAATWKGKWKCAYCSQKGWPLDHDDYGARWWGHRHGENCQRKPK